VAYIAVVPPIRFINITSSVGTDTKRCSCHNNSDDVLILRAFMIYLQNFRKDLSFTTTRLTKLAGAMDHDLSQMILDYKAFKTKTGQATIAFEEDSNDCVLPQKTHFALSAAARAPLLGTTIMSLNLDIKPVAGYGDNVIDVMCNLFPIRSKLTVPPLTGSRLWDGVRGPDLSSRYWRDLARNKVPWNAWPRKQQEEAMNERQGALVRARDANPTKLAITYDEDNELFDLLAPYQNEVKSFWENHTRIALTTSPSPSAHGQAVKVTISVTSYGGQTPQGAVKLWIASRETLRFHGRSILTPSRAQDLRLLNGSATFTVPELYSPASPYRVIAEYWAAGGFLGSTAEIEHEVR
jgi:hypothetical protein